jgi:hypothetical protein
MEWYLIEEMGLLKGAGRHPMIEQVRELRRC